MSHDIVDTFIRQLPMYTMRYAEFGMDIDGFFSVTDSATSSVEPVYMNSDTNQAVMPLFKSL